MKISNPVIEEHQLNVDDVKNISYVSSNGKFIIRKSMNKRTYYYGSYDSQEECFEIFHMLELTRFPVVLSQDIVRKRGCEYNDWLKKTLSELV